MDISDFDFKLPPDCIARDPVYPRDTSRLMVLDDPAAAPIDTRFDRLAEFLHPTDVLVINDTRVIRARTSATLQRDSGSSRNMEVFFVEPVSEKVWLVLCKPGRRIRPGDRAFFADGSFSATFRPSSHPELHRLEMDFSEPVLQVLERIGEIPLPPYIARNPTPADALNYQTMFAAKPGAVAAPTAGLHFTPDVLQAVRARGVQVASITLHVGIGTFLPVRTSNPAEHTLQPERFHVSEQTAVLLRSAMKEGRRLVAVGTTTTRTLEYLMREYGEIRPASGVTNIYILPGFRFRAVDALVTNFHLPKSTLLMLVSAFAGRERILNAYRHAVAQEYRFYSYGDCMLIQARAEERPAAAQG